MSATPPVVVIGAGPTGLTAAIQLAQLGVAVTVLERWDTFYPLPRAIAMDDEVQRIIARLGIHREFDAMSRSSNGLQLMDPRHRVLARFDRSGVSEASGFDRARQFDQPLLEQLLRDHAATFGSLITLRTGVEVTSIEQPDAGPVTLTLAGGEQLQAEFVLGCDGANSRTRAAIGATMRDLKFEQRWLVVDLDADTDLGQWPGVHQVCDTRRAATFMQGHDDRRYRWEFQLLDGEDVTADFGTLEQLMPMIEPWTGDVGPEHLTLVRTTEYTFRAQVADRWRDRRVFVLGDAAHLTPPFIGQGMAAGMRDAANLTWKVAGVVQGRLRPDVLDSYEAERPPHARSMIRLAKIVGAAMTGGGRFGSVVRRTLVPLMPHVPVVGRAALDSATPPLIINPWIRRSPLAGTWVPNVPIDGGRLDDLIAGRWALATRTPVAPSDRERLDALGVVVVEGALDGWLAEAGVGAALVRPDGAVFASDPRVSTLCGVVGQLVNA